MGSRQVLHRRGGHRELPRHQVEQQHANTVDIALDRRLLAPEDFWSQIEGRPDHAVRSGQLLACTEIHQHDPAALLAHDVLRLHVAMQETGAVNGGECGAYVKPDDRGFATTQRSTCLNQFLERGPADELHPQADTPSVFFGAVHLHHVLVSESREPPRFAEHVCFMVPVQQLHRDLAIELRVPGFENLAGHPLTDRLHEDQPAPWAACWHGMRRSGALGVLWRDAAVKGRDALDQSQVPEQASVVSSLVFGRVPVHGRPVGHRRRQIRKGSIVSSQWRGPSSPAVRSFWPMETHNA